MAPPRNKDTYTIEGVLKSRINSQTLKCEFKIKWEGYAEKEDQTWEEFDNVSQYPLIFRNFRIKSRTDLIKAAGNISDEAAEGMPDFPTIPAPIMSKFLKKADDREFFPAGTEKFAHGILELVSEQTSSVLWRVRCEKLQVPVFMNREIAIYYWPEDAALFTARLRHKEQCLQNFLAGQQESEAKKKRKE
jgi:hypothetical protein